MKETGGWRVVGGTNSGDAMGYGSWCHDGVGCWRKGRGVCADFGRPKKWLIFVVKLE